MNKATIILLACAVALPGSAVAQTAATPLVPVVEWSLKNPRKKAPKRVASATPADVQGPQVPPPQRQYIPPKRQPRQGQARPQSNENNPNAASQIVQIARGRPH